MSSVASISANSSFTAAISGVQRGQALVAQAAQSISEGEIDPQNMINLIEGQRTVEANLAVMRTEDEILGTILNTKA